MAKGTNAAVAPAQFPLRLISPTEYAHDDLNTTTMSYDYEIRVYKKGAPAGSTPLISTGSRRQRQLIGVGRPPTRAAVGRRNVQIWPSQGLPWSLTGHAHAVSRSRAE